MAWVYLIVAGLLETCWAVGLPYTKGFTKGLPSLVVGLAMVASMYLLALAVRTIPIGTGYAIWVSIGMVGAFVVDKIITGNNFRPLQTFFIGLLILGVVGLKLTTPTDGVKP